MKVAIWGEGYMAEELGGGEGVVDLGGLQHMRVDLLQLREGSAFCDLRELGGGVSLRRRPRVAGSLECWVHLSFNAFEPVAQNSWDTDRCDR